jgi:hypothetical protein
MCALRVHVSGRPTAEGRQSERTSCRVQLCVLVSKSSKQAVMRRLTQQADAEAEDRKEDRHGQAHLGAVLLQRQLLDQLGPWAHGRRGRT